MQTKLLKPLLVLAMIAVTPRAQAISAPAEIAAQYPDTEKYLTIDKKTVEVSEATESYDFHPESQMVPGTRYDLSTGLPADAPAADGAGGTVGEIGVILDQIINIGQKIWKIVDDGKPVVNAQEMRASAVPQGITSWQQLQGWNAPISRTYRLQYTNLYGITVVDYSFKVTYTYGGNFNGKGNYLTNVSVAPAALNVLWGYTAESSAYVPSVINLGTSADPVAGMELQVKWHVKTLLVDDQGQAGYFVDGKGNYRSLE